MRRLKISVFSIGWILGLGFSLPVWAGITGLSLIQVPSGNFAQGSHNNVALEFQFTGTTSSTDLFQAVTISQPFGSAQANTDLTNSLIVWYQPSSPMFSPGAAVSIGTLTAVDPGDWINGPDNSTPVFNFPVTALTGYFFITTNVNSATVQDGDQLKMQIAASGVSLSAAGTLSNSILANNAAQGVTTVSGISGFALIAAPATFVSQGATDVPVIGVSITAGGPDVLQNIQIFNRGSAVTTDISSMRVWYQANGGAFNASTAVELGTLPATSGNSWNNANFFYWTVNAGDGLYVTADIFPSAVSSRTCAVSISGNGIFFDNSSNASSLSNPQTQVIGLPTATPTITNTPPAPTATFTATPTSTPTHTPLVVASPTPTATNTSPVFTPTNTPPVSVTSGATATPVPVSALSLSANFFSPSQGLGLQIEVTQPGQVRVEVFNLAGERVRMVLDSFLSKGSYVYTWDGKNDHGLIVGNGVYLVVLRGPSGRQVRKVILLK